MFFLFSVSIIIAPFKFLTVVDIIFCIRNGHSFVNGVSSSDSNIMNFGNRGSGCIFFPCQSCPTLCKVI